MSQNHCIQCCQGFRCADIRAKQVFKWLVKCICKQEFNKGGTTMRVIALLLVMLLVTPAFGMGAWDGLKEQGKVYETGPDHPPVGSAQGAVLATMGVVSNPIYQALTTGVESAAHASFMELQGFGVFHWAMVQGPILEARTAPSKVGKFEHNGHVVTGEGAKWERDPDHVGWNRLVRYDTIGPGSDKTKDYFSAIDRVGN